VDSATNNPLLFGAGAAALTYGLRSASSDKDRERLPTPLAAFIGMTALVALLQGLGSFLSGMRAIDQPSLPFPR